MSVSSIFAAQSSNLGYGIDETMVLSGKKATPYSHEAKPKAENVSGFKTLFIIAILGAVLIYR